MRKRVHVKLAMYKTVQQVLSANGPAWEGIPALVSTIETFNLKLTSLEELAVQQGSITAGVRITKEKHKAVTLELTERILGALKSFARTTGNHELNESIRFNSSKLKSSGNSTTLMMIDTILSKGFEHLSSLQNYGIGETELLLLQAHRNELNQLFPSMRTAIINRREINSRIYQTVKEIDFLLINGLDPLMIVLRKDHGVLYKKYVFSRIIVDFPSKTKKVDPPSEPDEGF